MTTIAYRDGVIAFDSRITEGDLIISDNYLKCYTDGSYRVFFAGDVILAPLLIELVKEEIPAPASGELEAIVWTGNVLLWAGLEEGHFYRIPLPVSSSFAIGSGKAHAYTAMDMGADAVTAVKMAGKRDKNTGGVINTFNLASLD
jgi:ATP-dependent protease HslVU (ClpYQ) peptidase subunit